MVSAAVLFLYQLFKVEKCLVLAAAAHTGREHLVGRLILPVALGYYPIEVHLIQSPFRGSPERLRAIAVSGISLINTAAQLRAAR